MRKLSTYLLFFTLFFLVAACTDKSKVPTSEPVVTPEVEVGDNPFFAAFEGPFGVPPFDKIKDEHFKPALEAGIRKQEAEVDDIAKRKSLPTFENTIEALEYSGDFLARVEYTFWNYTSSDSSETLQKVEEEMSPKLTQLIDNIFLNAALYQRVKAVYEQRDKLELTAEQHKLLEETHKSFVRRGANLAEDKKARLREINKKLSVLSAKFSNNLLADSKSFKLVIEDEADLDGLPQGVLDSAAAAAKAAGLEGKWVFTTDRPSMYPFLTYSTKRDLREKLHKAYAIRGNQDNENDNKEIIKEMIQLRIKRSKIFGFKDHASFVLDENMAKTPENVYELLKKVWDPALETAKEEVKEMQALIDAEGGDFKLQHWDWWYYAEKLRQAKYDLAESELTPYFELEAVLSGMFQVVNKLWGLSFTELDNMPLYNKDARAFEVKERDGSHVGILYMDFFARDSKRGGAWMSSFRKQKRNQDGSFVHPIIVNVFNFGKPAPGKPSLLSLREVETLYHELGHGLHGLVSNCRYLSLSGTSVSRDFVELPSQILENWATDPAVLPLYAKHHETGEVIPAKLVEKMEKAKFWNQGFATVEYMSAVYLDLDWHTLTDPAAPIDVNAFETEKLTQLGLIPEIVVRYRTPYFLHIFSHGYDAGYYAYMWAEVLDADAFEAFAQSEAGVFDPKLARSFRKNILERGGTEDPMKLYLKFRGQEPSIEPLLKRRGFLK